MNTGAEIRLKGNVASMSDLHYNENGHARLNFQVASSDRYFDQGSESWKESERTFIGVSVWRGQAENAFESLRVGARVIVIGRLASYTVKAEKPGEKDRDVHYIEADEIAASVKFNTVTVPERERKRDKTAA